MPSYDYEIGTTSSTTNVESLATPVNPPRGRMKRYTRHRWTQDGKRKGDGFPEAWWDFDYLTQAMIDQMRTFVGEVLRISINAGGSGYAADEVLTIGGGGGSNATATIVSVDGAGAVTSISLTTGGNYYSPTTGAATTGGSGNNCTLNVLRTGGASSTAYINTKDEGDDGFSKYQCVMHWPDDLADRFTANGFYKDVTFHFTQLEDA